MARRDDVNRVLVSCEACDSVYAARQWPDGSVKVIGQEGCSCGSTDFEVLEEDDSDWPPEPDAG